MALFFWTHTPSGDWSDGANWTPVGPALPTPGPDDIAFFGELPSNYTVNVAAGDDDAVEAMIIDPTTPFTGDPTFFISGSLTTEFLDYATAFGGPATSMTINAGGSLDITTALASIRIPETITIAGGELVLGSPLVGDAGSNVSFDFENTTGPNGSNTGVIQIDATGAGREVPLDHPDLSRGWWAVERDGQLMSRWTNGEAVLPLAEMSGHVMLEIHLAGSMIYAVDTAPEGGMEQRAAA